MSAGSARRDRLVEHLRAAGPAISAELATWLNTAHDDLVTPSVVGMALARDDRVEKVGTRTSDTKPGHTLTLWSASGAAQQRHVPPASGAVPEINPRATLPGKVARLATAIAEIDWADDEVELRDSVHLLLGRRVAASWQPPQLPPPPSPALPVTSEPAPAKATPRSPPRRRRCSGCGSTGHDVRRCGKVPKRERRSPAKTAATAAAGEEAVSAAPDPATTEIVDAEDAPQEERPPPLPPVMRPEPKHVEGEPDRDVVGDMMTAVLDSPTTSPLMWLPELDTEDTSPNPALWIDLPRSLPAWATKKAASLQNRALRAVLKRLNAPEGASVTDPVSRLRLSPATTGLLSDIALPGGACLTLHWDPKHSRFTFAAVYAPPGSDVEYVRELADNRLGRWNLGQRQDWKVIGVTAEAAASASQGARVAEVVA